MDCILKPCFDLTGRDALIRSSICRLQQANQPILIRKLCWHKPMDCLLHVSVSKTDFNRHLWLLTTWVQFYLCFWSSHLLRLLTTSVSHPHQHKYSELHNSTSHNVPSNINRNAWCKMQDVTELRRKRCMLTNSTNKVHSQNHNRKKVKGVSVVSAI